VAAPDDHQPAALALVVDRSRLPRWFLQRRRGRPGWYDSGKKEWENEKKAGW
jgi:hypothetical protein